MVGLATSIAQRDETCQATDRNSRQKKGTGLAAYVSGTCVQPTRLYNSKHTRNRSIAASSSRHHFFVSTFYGRLPAFTKPLALNVTSAILFSYAGMQEVVSGGPHG